MPVDASTEDRSDQRRATVVRIVRPEDCATRWGNEGLNVLSTPAILGTMEQACVELIAPCLRPGEMTVGTQVEMTHLAATPEGDEVSYDIALVLTGKRIQVEFTVTDTSGTVVSQGRHGRAIVMKDRFLARIPSRNP